jgi:hypothetical protein
MSLISKISYAVHKPYICRKHHEDLISSTAPCVPTILSSRIRSYLENSTRQLTSAASTPSSRNGNDRNSVKYCGWSGGP